MEEEDRVAHGNRQRSHPDLHRPQPLARVGGNPDPVSPSSQLIA
jgi:hypothetical protein